MWQGTKLWTPTGTFITHVVCSLTNYVQFLSSCKQRKSSDGSIIFVRGCQHLGGGGRRDYDFIKISRKLHGIKENSPPPLDKPLNGCLFDRNIWEGLICNDYLFPYWLRTKLNTLFNGQIWFYNFTVFLHYFLGGGVNLRLPWLVLIFYPKFLTQLENRQNTPP